MTQHHSAFSPPDAFNNKAVDHPVEMKSRKNTQSKVFSCIVNVRWYLPNDDLHSDLGVERDLQQHHQKISNNPPNETEKTCQRRDCPSPIIIINKEFF